MNRQYTDTEQIADRVVENRVRAGVSSFYAVGLGAIAMAQEKLAEPTDLFISPLTVSRVLGGISVTAAFYTANKMWENHKLKKQLTPTLNNFVQPASPQHLKHKS